MTVGASNRKANSPRAEREKPAPVATSSQDEKVAVEKTQPPRENTSKAEPVRVIVKIENGRVAKASIANPKPGMDAVEALALRIARQRRYPGKVQGRSPS